MSVPRGEAAGGIVQYIRDGGCGQCCTRRQREGAVLYSCTVLYQKDAVEHNIVAHAARRDTARHGTARWMRRGGAAHGRMGGASVLRRARRRADEWAGRRAGAGAGAGATDAGRATLGGGAAGRAGGRAGVGVDAGGGLSKSGWHVGGGVGCTAHAIVR